MHLQFIYIVYEFSWIICLKAYQFDLDWDISCALYLLLLLGKDMTSQLSSIFLYFLFSSLWLVTADRKWPRYTTQMVNVVESVHEAACRVSPAFLPSLCLSVITFWWLFYCNIVFLCRKWGISVLLESFENSICNSLETKKCDKTNKPISQKWIGVFLTK